jgi:hypothetical protein
MKYCADGAAAQGSEYSRQSRGPHKHSLICRPIVCLAFSAVTGTRKVGSVPVRVPELKNSFGSGSGTRTESIWVPENKNF